MWNKVDQEGKKGFPAKRGYYLVASSMDEHALCVNIMEYVRKGDFIRDDDDHVYNGETAEKRLLEAIFNPVGREAEHDGFVDIGTHKIIDKTYYWDYIPNLPDGWDTQNEYLDTEVASREETP